MTADFTSAGFLGYHHPWRSLGNWSRLTTGRPATLDEPPDHPRLAARLAALQGADAGLLARSSLHALLDVLVTTTSEGGAVVLDECVYPIGRWAAAIAGSSGTTIVPFRHHDAASASRALRALGRRRRTVILTDGWCPGCMQPSPLPELLAAARRRGSLLIVDDSLAAGVLGTRQAATDLLGRGGGGTPSWLGTGHPDLVWVASTAKAWGAPLAVVTGPAGVVSRIRSRGPARLHASPPGSADVVALTRALGDRSAEARRAALSRNVCRIRDGFGAAGLALVGRPFPMVSLDLAAAESVELHRRLRRAGIRTLLVERRCARRPAVSLCVRADHRQDEVESLLITVDRIQRARRVA